MSDLSNVAPGGGESAPAPVIVPTPAADTAPISAREAASALSKRRWEKSREQSEQQAAPAPSEINDLGRRLMAGEKVEQQQELADEANAAPDESQDPGETKADEPAAEELPPIEPPRSWAKEEKERFKSYPRELQAYLSEREQERDRSLRTSQNEAAEKLKGLTAKEQAVEQARQKYEAALPALLQTLQDQQAGTYADIKTAADVDRLASEDPLRYIKWMAHQQKVAAVQQEIKDSQERQAKEYQDQWAQFAEREDKLIAEKIPELADPAQRAKIQESALSYLTELGFKESELGQAWNGQASISLRDHRVQGMIRDAVKYREGQQAAKKAITVKPLPPVQRPGVAPQKGNDSNIQALSRKLDTTGNIKDAAALISARRAAARR